MNENEELRASQCSIGMRVITVSGTRRTGTVRALDVANNVIGVRFDGEDRVTPMCAPSAFTLSPDPNLRLTGKAPEGSVARGTL